MCVCVCVCVCVSDCGSWLVHVQIGGRSKQRENNNRILARTRIYRGQPLAEMMGGEEGGYKKLVRLVLFCKVIKFTFVFEKLEAILRFVPTNNTNNSKKLCVYGL